MAAKSQLDAAGGARKGHVILFLAAVLILGSPGFAQDQPSDKKRSTQGTGKKQRI